MGLNSKRDGFDLIWLLRKGFVEVREVIEPRSEMISSVRAMKANSIILAKHLEHAFY